MQISEQARGLAERLHAGQVRRESGLSFFAAHLEHVASMVRENGGDDLAVAAAYLHDVLEDIGVEHAGEIAAISPELLVIVRQLTEEGATWEEEKKGYVAEVAKMDARALLVSICDKTCNASDFVAEWKQGKFGKRPSQILWFFGELITAYGERDREISSGRNIGLIWDLTALLGEMQNLLQAAR